MLSTPSVDLGSEFGIEDISRVSVRSLHAHGESGINAPAHNGSALDPFLMGFTREELEAFKDATVPDLIGPDTKLLFVGINPGLWTAATQTHFAHPGNRFYPALFAAGVINREIDRSNGFTEADRTHLIERGVGITNIVQRATARASELTDDELRAGGLELSAKVADISPAVVAIAGITAYRTAFGRKKAVVGPQPEKLAGSELWVVPNPSGLNAHETTETLTAKYREVAVAAGIVGSHAA